MDEETEICPICKLNIAKTVLFSNCELISCKCRDCGHYIMSRPLFHLYQTAKEDKKQIRMRSAVMLERNLKGLNEGVRIKIEDQGSFCFESTGEELSRSYPSSFRDKLVRGFCNIIRSLRWSPTVSFSLDNIKHEKKALLFIDDAYESENVILGYMVDEGWLIEAPSGDSRKHYRATAKGMDLFDANKTKQKSDNAFLAMWFGVAGNSLYREAVQRGVAAAGYHLQVVDQEEYNGFIMDKVVNLINDSAFVIADLSAAPEVIEDGKVKNGVRGGVYWEAGYAAGQKKQVVLTCRDDVESMKRIHFDLQQHNQIRWKVVDDAIITSEGVDLAEAIEQRIRATVGAAKK